MSDTTTVWSPDASHGDWSIIGPNLQAGDDLSTAVLISIFTDGTANPDDKISDGSGDPRGWWGDAGKDVPVGSRLWLLDRSKQTSETLALARDYITQALQWLIDDGAVAKFDIFTEWTRASLLGARVTAYRQDGTTVALNFSWIWN